MKKRIVIALGLILFFFLLVSCSPKVPGGNTPGDTAAALKASRTGTEGVKVSLVPNFPPPLIYDEQELVAIIEVRNRGSNGLAPQDCFVQVTGFDPNIIRGNFMGSRSCAEGLGELEGKSIYNLEGSFNNIEFSSDPINLPNGVFEYNPTLNFLACYTYHTSANPSVCIDPLFYQVTSEQKTCTPVDVGMGGGQGGPVGVSYVGVDMVGSKAMFEINVQQFGVGTVLSPYADPRNCGNNIEFGDLNRVGYSVQFSGGNIANCKPSDGLVRLNNGAGKIFCSFDIPGGSAYETPLVIDLDYGYVESFSKQVKIIKTPQ